MKVCSSLVSASAESYRQTEIAHHITHWLQNVAMVFMLHMLSGALLMCCVLF